MIQQTLLQSYDNIKNRLRSLGESTSDRHLMNGAKTTKKQTIQSTNKNENTYG